MNPRDVDFMYGAIAIGAAIAGAAVTALVAWLVRHFA